jgi:hypothetical protein
MTLFAVQVIPRPPVNGEPQPLPPWRLEGIKPLPVVAYDALQFTYSNSQRNDVLFRFLDGAHKRTGHRYDPMNMTAVGVGGLEYSVTV